MRATFQEERRLWKNGYRVVVCLDEAGRGPLAGPVVAAAALTLPRGVKKSKAQNEKLQSVKDSKKLLPKKREEVYGFIVQDPNIKWGIGIVSEKIIDKINILEATKLAMRKALSGLERKLGRKADFIIIDGNFLINAPRRQKAIIKADEKVFSCAAASIIAKVTRDRIMMRLHKKHPQYGFDRHKGYPTALHKKKIAKYGFSPVHRISFRWR